MVEFAIILIIVFAVCTGMLTMMRLLTYQYWARQEARFLAFEQDWVPHAFYGDPVGEPKAKLEDEAFFGRSRVASTRTKSRDIDDDGGLEDLLSRNERRGTGAALPERPIAELDGGPTVLARADTGGAGRSAHRLGALRERPLWERRTSEWFEPGGTVDRAFSFVQSAFAFDRGGDDGVSRALQGDEPRGPEVIGDYRDRLQPKLRGLLHEIGFGPKVCGALRTHSARHGDPFPLRKFRSSDCDEWLEGEFAEQLAYGVDIPDFFRGYGERIESGFTAGEALENSVREEVATQFFSLFDTIVGIQQTIALGDTLSQTADKVQSFAEDKFLDMITDARYIGSSVALVLVAEKAVEILGNNPLSRDVNGAISFEQSVVDTLHTDADDALPVISPFFLSPLYLPVPPTFGSLGGGLQEAVMKNFYAQPEDSTAKDEQITNSNKQVQVTYDAAGGLFASLKPVEGAEEARLSANFYVVTQPWHLERRKNGTGDYREKGNANDSASEETEEGVMRRRVLGMWIIPDNLPAFLEPLATVVGLEDVASAFEALEPISSVVSFVKRFVTDNPLLDIANALASIPVVGNLVPVPPRFPAVRPDAYPGSKELQGLEMDRPDKLMEAKPREFSDYVTEQRNNNPEPNPEFE